MKRLRTLTLSLFVVTLIAGSTANATTVLDGDPRTYFKMPNAGATAEIQDTNFFGWFWAFFD